MRIALQCVGEQLKEAKAKLASGLHRECVAVLKQSIAVLKWLESNSTSSDAAFVQEATAALRQVGELHTEAEWALAERKLKGVAQYASQLHKAAGAGKVSNVAPRSFKPVRKAIIAAREAYLRLLDEPWLPHRGKTLKKLKSIEDNPHLRPPDAEIEYEEAVVLLTQARSQLEAGELDPAREATMEAAQILSVTDPTQDRAVQGLIMEVMILEHSLTLAAIHQAHRKARRALLTDDVDGGMAACGEARLRLNDLMEEAHQQEDESQLHELIRVATELDETQGRLTVQRDLEGSKQRLKKAEEHLRQGRESLAGGDTVMAEVSASRSENIKSSLLKQHVALVEALGTAKLDQLEADLKELTTAIGDFSLRDPDAEMEEGDEEDHRCIGQEVLDRLIRDINVNAKPSEHDDDEYEQKGD